MKKNKNNPSKTKEKLTDRRNKQKSKHLITGINFFLVLINIIVLIFLPKQAEKVVTVRSEILAHNLQLQSSQKIITDLKAIEEEKQKILNTFPAKSQLLNVIELVESLNEYVTVQNFNFETDIPIENKNRQLFIPLTINLEGSFSAITQALNKLQTADYLLSVNNTLAEFIGDSSGNLKVRLSLNLYVNKPFSEN